MPQPLSKVAPNAAYSICNVGDYPLARHPDLALLVAEVISSWSNVEAFHLNLFINLMGGKKDKAAKIFLSLESRSARLSAIRAIAADLPEKHRNLLNAILSISRSYSKARDKIAHHVWGDSHDLPDALLLVDPKYADFETLDRSKVFVYRKNDFQRIIKDNERLAHFGGLLDFISQPVHSAGKDHIYERLSQEPEIAEQLRRQSRVDKTRQAK